MPVPAPPLAASPTRPTTTSAPSTGLTAVQVAEQRRAGATNAPVTGTSRSYAAIVRTHVLSTYTTILFSVGVVLLVLGRPGDALTSVGIGLVNALIGLVQECRAKRKPDRLALLDGAAARVVRDGAEVDVPAAEFAIAAPAVLVWSVALAVTFRRRVVGRLVALTAGQAAR